MKYFLMSDLHLTYRNMSEDELFWLLPPDKDSTLILLGDVVEFCRLGVGGSDRKYIQFLVDHWTKVLYVPGNHEYYGSDVARVSKEAMNFLHSFPNLHLLDNGTYEDGDDVFIGSTLWTNFALSNHSMKECKKFHDFSFIKNEGMKITPEFIIDLYYNSIEFINREVMKVEKEGKKAIVCTHFAPSFNSIPWRYRYQFNGLNDYFFSNLEEFIKRRPTIKWWLHGHIHDGCKYMIGNTRVMCNPLGNYKETSNGTLSDNEEFYLAEEITLDD